MDGRVEEAVHSFVLHHRWIADVARVVTHLGDPLVVTVLTLVVAALLWRRADHWSALLVVAARLAAIVVATGLKTLVHRSRPLLAHPVAHAHGYSFPSGHALGSAALWGSVAWVASGRGVPRGPAVALAVAVPVLVAATRVLLGVHYLTDVVAGLLLGWACPVLVGWVCAVIRRRRTP
jgi:membrane-associated phospholipid phosphatase